MGVDKALLRVDGEQLVVRVIDALRDAGADPIVVVRSNEQAGLAVDGVEVVVDGAHDQGPLEGIRTGLEAVGHRADAIVVAPVDVPWLEPSLVRVLVRALDEHPGALAALPSRAGRLQPLVAAYRPQVLDIATELLAEGERRARALPARCASVVLDEEALLADVELRMADPSLASLDDVDVPGDLAQR
jgi:molybdopterin-guanine dinucleotide biosynthesis protein A